MAQPTNDPFERVMNNSAAKQARGYGTDTIKYNKDIDIDPSLFRKKGKHNVKTPILTSNDVDNFAKLYDIKSRSQPLFTLNPFGDGKINVAAYKFAGKTGLNVAGGIGMLGSSVGALARGDKSHIWDNTYNNWINAQTEYIDQNWLINGPADYHDKNIGQQLGTFKFWADDFLGAISFVVGAVLTETALTAATTASGLTAAPAQAAATASIMSRLPSIFTTASKAKGAVSSLKGIASAARNSKTLGLSRQIITGAFYEAGVEANQFKKEAIKAMTEKAERDLGRELTEEEKLNIEDYAVQGGNSVFALNSALVGFTNFLTFGRVFNIGLKDAIIDPAAKNLGIHKLAGNMVGAKSKVLSPANKLVTDALRNKVVRGSYALLKPFVSEGLIEEAGQAAITDGILKYTLNSYSSDAQGTAMDIALDVASAYGKNFGTKDFWKEVTLGGLIGLAGSPTMSKVDKKTGQRKFGFGWESGLTNAWKEASDKITEYDNVKAATEATSSYIQKHFKTLTGVLQSYSDLETALKNNDMFSAKNSEHELIYRQIYKAHKDKTIHHLLEAVDSAANNSSVEEWKNALSYGNSITEEERNSF